MQVMSNVMQMPIRIHKSEQTCALGAAMFAATAAKVFENVEQAMTAMGQGFDAIYQPDTSTANYYATRMEAYHRLGAFLETEYQ
jgi:L-ribulokinase